MRTTPSAIQIISIIGTVLLFSCSAPPEDSKETPGAAVSDSFESGHLVFLDRVIEESIADGLAGAVVLIGHRGHTVYRKAFGYRSLTPVREAMTIDTVFDMASLTKVMATAASLMILVEEGRISLSDKVIDYLPGFAPSGQSCQKGTERACVTLLHLATHYSGLPPDIEWKSEWSGYETAIQKGLAEELAAPPGERFIYSDIGYLLLAEIVRRVGGQSIEEFSRQRIFQPLGMTSTTFHPPSSMVSRIAPSEPRHLADPASTNHQGGEMLRGRVHDPTTDRMGGASGHAGLFSTADDVAIFAQMILGEGEANQVRILSPLAVRAMTTAQSPRGRLDLRGIGFDIDTAFSTVRGDLFPVGSFGHTGFTGTSLWIDSSTQTFVILLTNRLHPDGQGSVVSMRRKVASVVAASLRKLPSAAQRP